MIEETFRRFFRPRIEVLGPHGRLNRHSEGAIFGRRIIVIPRARCHYHYKRGDYSRAKAVKALELALQHESHFDRLGRYIRADRDGAAIWTWDGAEVGADLPDGGAYTIMPESALVAPSPSALRLVRCIQGVEGQVWRDGHLDQSRWWSQDPEQAEWMGFVRSARHDPAMASPKPVAETVEWRAPRVIDEPVLPWLERVARERYATIAVLLLIGPICYQLAQWGYAAWAQAHYREQTTALRQSARPVVAARRDSLAAMAEVRAQAELGDEKLLLTGLLDLIEVFGDRDISVQRIILDETNIAVHLSGLAEGQAADLVQELEGTDSWSGVNIQSNRANVFILQGRLNSTGGIDGAAGLASQLPPSPAVGRGANR